MPPTSLEPLCVTQASLLTEAEQIKSERERLTEALEHAAEVRQAAQDRIGSIRELLRDLDKRELELARAAD